MIWKIQKKPKLNCEMIWKIWKKGKLKCEMIWKIWKKGKSNSEKIWNRVEIPPKTRYKQTQNETHYENITH
jgi:hypothetical protein